MVRNCSPAIGRLAGASAITLAMTLAAAVPVVAQPRPPGTLRIATFNVFELSCAKIDDGDAQGQTGAHPQLLKAAEILRRVQPDIVLINEIDYAADSGCARRFAERYLTNAHEGLAPLALPHLVYLPVNTGVPSGLDLTNNGVTTDPGDAFGFGTYPGQYGMALFSRHPIDDAAVRTFQRFLWKDMPGRVMPDGESGRPAFYSPAAVRQFRLSSKSHWDVPVRVDGRILHLLASHPSPPVHDGPEDANGRRNFDEIRLWADYLTGGTHADYLVDDQGRRGGLPAGASFVVAGDLNADALIDLPAYGRTAIAQLLDHPRIQDPKPRSDGRWPSVPSRSPYPGDPHTQTAGVGRLDYVLPARDLEVAGAGIWYPPDGDPLRALVTPPSPASDHALVWVDLRWTRR